MPRDLDAQQNSITLVDSVTGEKVQFFYRTPQPSEIQAYASATVKRKGGKVIIRSVEPKLKYGLEILTGVQEGYFLVDFHESAEKIVKKPLSSNSANENYRADWKDLLKAKAPELIILFAAQIFDGSRVVRDGAEPEIEEAEEDAAPFTKS